jgi:hypothetical protein
MTSEAVIPCPSLGLDRTDILKKRIVFIHLFLISSWMRKEKSSLETSMQEAE